jgi:hypothetical protein
MSSAGQKSMPLLRKERSSTGVATTRVIVKARTIALTVAHCNLVSKTPDPSLETLATGWRTWKSKAQAWERP